VRFGHVNASAAQVWRWFKFPGTDFEVELRLVTRTELVASTKGARDDGYPKYVVEHWFRDFKNAKDVNGVDIPNTPDNRLALLDDLDLWRWMQDKFQSASEWREEGNGGSDSGS
jgi:hypothetical protein